MRPVTQTRFGMPHGNCFAACVASILEVRIECVANVMHYDDKWYPAFHLWSRRHGLRLIVHPWTEEGRAFIAEHFPDAYLIVAGPAARGFDHCCVYQGDRLVWDPHPDRVGLIRENDWSALTLSDPRRLEAFRSWALLGEEVSGG